MTKLKNISIFLVLLLASIDGFGQANETDLYGIKNSTRIFQDTIQSNSNKQAQYNEYKYEFMFLSCMRYIFRNDGSLILENACAGDYITRSTVGHYKYTSENQMDLWMDTLGIQGFNLDKLFVDKIEYDSSTSSNLSFQVFDLEKEELGKVLTIRYKKRPFFFTNSKTMSLRHDDLNELIGRKIFLELISVETIKGDARTVHYIPINKAIEFKSKNYKIFLRKNWGIIKKIKNKFILFYWDHVKQDFSKVEELI